MKFRKKICCVCGDTFYTTKYGHGKMKYCPKYECSLEKERKKDDKKTSRKDT